MSRCEFCDPHFKEKNQWRMLEKYMNDDAWVMIPFEPATYGHILVISTRTKPDHFTDIADCKLSEDLGHLNRVINVVHNLSKDIQKKLTCQRKRVKKVYVLTLCETPHLHFHLIPRYEGDNTGYLFLFEKELEETRWPKGEEEKTDTIFRGYKRIGQMEGVLEYHKLLLRSDKWAKTPEERKQYIEKIKKDMDI